MIVAGPTASGKTGAGVALAELCGGQVVNADSMQIYRDVPTLTARPDAAQMRGVPHRLFGFLPPDAKFGVVKWLKAASREADDIFASGGVPVFVGGTGLYFDALMNGVNEIPDVPAKVRDGVCARFDAMGRDAFLADYLQKDPSFRFVDRQRVETVREPRRLPLGVMPRRPFRQRDRLVKRNAAVPRGFQFFHAERVQNARVSRRISGVQRVDFPENVLLHHGVEARVASCVQDGAFRQH